MIGSTPPVAEQANWHPVHRANAMLRAALLSSARPVELTADVPSVESLSRAVESVLREPVSITFPVPLAARLDALEIKEDAFPAFEALVEEQHRQDVLEHGAAPEQAVADNWEESENAFDEAEILTAGMPLDSELHLLPPQVHMQSLLREFQRRQRHASLLVACSIATAILLTLGGIWIIASFSSPHAVGSNNHPLGRFTSVAWQKPAMAVPHPAVTANREAKGESLLVPALADSRAASPEASPVQAQFILAASGRQIAFAPLLPPSHAGYFLVRGLPAEAKLSTGRRSASGAWLVKAEHAHMLTLAIGNVADGDYPIEVYVLRSGDAPQARRNLVLRIEPQVETQTAAGPARSWASALLDVVPAARAAEAPEVPVQSAVLRQRANRLLDEGDIAAARLLLLYLAEQGEGEAAYELARTFDHKMLAALGAKGMTGDLERARDWYAFASQRGNAQAAERLKVLASLTGTRPSD
jgi:hypothetical protein